MTDGKRGQKSAFTSPDLPIVVGQLGPFLSPLKYPFVGTVRAAIVKVSQELPHASLADSAGLKDKGDSLHFDAESQAILGARYAKAMIQAEAGK